MLEKGVWAVFSCLTQVSLRVTLGRGSTVMKRLLVEYILCLICEYLLEDDSYACFMRFHAKEHEKVCFFKVNVRFCMDF